MFRALANGQFRSYIDPAIQLYDDAGDQVAIGQISSGDTGSKIVYVVDILGLSEPFEIPSRLIGRRYRLAATHLSGRRRSRAETKPPPSSIALLTSSGV